MNNNKWNTFQSMIERKETIRNKHRTKYWVSAKYLITVNIFSGINNTPYVIR